jgi:tetratricopeptide (TPR) repeat protein
MNSKISSRFATLAFLLAALLLSACSPSAEKLNYDGNQAFAEGNYDEAQFAYQSAAEESPDLAEPYYNLANTLYRKGGFDQAIQQIQQAISLATEGNLAQNGLYNLGNNTFNLQDWATAIEAYKQALLLNPDDQDAKYNLELALQQMQQQEQQQEEQEQNQEGQDEEQQEGSGQEQEQQDQGEQNQDQQGAEEQPGQGEQEEQSQGEGQPEEGEGGDQPWEIPQPGEKMTEDQAKQLLAALLQNSQTLQEKLGEILFVRSLPPLQDW